jgi:uncharacterized protein (TIGR02444 family)
MSFWNFSNTIYRIPAVAEACLSLQNNSGLDVNMVLFCCWHGISRGDLDKVFFQECHDFSRTWSGKTVKPLRDIRIWLKETGCSGPGLDTDTCMSFRDRIKAVELEAEKLQQLTLESLCQKGEKHSSTDGEMTETVARNLKIYLETEKTGLSDPLIRELETVVQAGIPNMDKPLFRRTLST